MSDVMMERRQQFQYPVTVGEVIASAERENYCRLRDLVLSKSGTSEFQMRLPQWNAFCSRLHHVVHDFGWEEMESVLEVEKEAEAWLTSKVGRRLYPDLWLPV